MLVVLGLLLSASTAAARSPVVVAVDVGTESCRAAVFDASGANLGSSSSKHETTYPATGWAEQSPADWWSGLGASVRAALAEAGCEAEDCQSICLATTSCTVLACDADGEPLRPALLWMDSRSAGQAARILADGRGDPALAVHCDSAGPISAECVRRPS